jgi:GNAT superfamily N-acetyltransferase
MIRPFEPEDWPEFIRLMHRLHEEGAASTLAFSERAMLESLKRPGMFHILAISGEGEVVGVCMGYLDKTFFGPDLVAHQHIFYVVPEARGGWWAREMMRAFEGWACSAGAKEIWVSQATGIQIERTQRFFEALGFEAVGCIARKVAI